MASSENVKNRFKWKEMKEPKLAQKNKVLYKQFRVMHSEGKPIIGPSVIKKVNFAMKWK